MSTGQLATTLLRALALAATLSALVGCSAVSSVVETSKRWTAKLTGADDPNNTSALAQAGRLQNAGTDAVAGAAGVKPPTAAASAPAEVGSSPPVSGSAPAPVQAAGTPEPAKPSPPPDQEPMSVAEMQRILASLGYDPGPADGMSGKRTGEALKKFQRANKLQPTGTLDADTAARLRAAKKTP